MQDWIKSVGLDQKCRTGSKGVGLDQKMQDWIKSVGLDQKCTTGLKGV